MKLKHYWNKKTVSKQFQNSFTEVVSKKNERRLRSNTGKNI